MLPESDYNILSEIYTDRPQNRNPAKLDHLRPVIGLDTEATSGGDMILIADSDGRYLDKITAENVLDFLFYKKYEDAYNVFFHIQYDAIIILKLLGEELKRYLQTGILEFYYNDYRIKYIPKKCLTISKGHHSVSFYDIAQFYGSSLLAAYEKYIGPAPDWYKDLKGKRDQISHRFYRRHPELLRNYCRQDCIMANALGEYWLSIFHKASDIYPRRLLSGAYLVCKAMINRGVAFPRFDVAPYLAQFVAYQATFGPRIEMLKRGFIGEGWNYDINSAYPDKIGKLPDLSEGEWIEGQVVNPKTKLGFFRIKADIPDWKYITPFPFRAHKSLVFPTGKFITYATIDELRACENVDYYEILESWQFIPNGGNNYYRPYADFIAELYAKKSELKSKGDPMYLPFKVMINSIYGKAGEVIDRGGFTIMGEFFNSVIFSSILGSSRAQLYSFIMNRGIEKDVVYMHTDSVCTTKDLEIDSDRLGEFAFKGHASDLFCIQNGINRFNGEWKERGIGKMRGRRIENYKIEEENGKVFMRLRVERVQNIRSAIRQNKISEIGKFKQVTRQLDLNADQKRIWIGRLLSLGNEQFNDSRPLPLNYFSKEEI